MKAKSAQVHCYQGEKVSTPMLLLSNNTGLGPELERWNRHWPWRGPRGSPRGCNSVQLTSWGSGRQYRASRKASGRTAKRPVWGNGYVREKTQFSNVTSRPLQNLRKHMDSPPPLTVKEVMLNTVKHKIKCPCKFLCTCIQGKGRREGEEGLRNWLDSLCVTFIPVGLINSCKGLLWWWSSAPPDLNAGNLGLKTWPTGTLLFP